VFRMEQMIRAAGLALSSRRETWMWSVDVYRRVMGGRITLSRPAGRRGSTWVRI
jgi:hypothetical protein